jgi:hypothetical protein
VFFRVISWIVFPQRQTNDPRNNTKHHEIKAEQGYC